MSVKLGRMPVKSDIRALMFSKYAQPLKALPKATNFWRRRAPFPLRTFGNLAWSDCTRAKQAIAAMRMERLECRTTPKITDEEVVRVYREMSDRLYGGGDNGAYETDALSDWRRPDLTFRDTKGRPLTIDAFTRLNPFDHEEVKTALWTAGARGIAVCFNLPLAVKNLPAGAIWDIPQDQQMTGPYEPGSWGGHSMWGVDYNEAGLTVPHTWGIPDQLVTWRFCAAYMDEAHVVIDSMNSWRKRVGKKMDPSQLQKDVNKVSPQKVG